MKAAAPFCRIWAAAICRIKQKIMTFRIVPVPKHGYRNCSVLAALISGPLRRGTRLCPALSPNGRRPRVLYSGLAARDLARRRDEYTQAKSHGRDHASRRHSRAPGRDRALAGCIRFPGHRYRQKQPRRMVQALCRWYLRRRISATTSSGLYHGPGRRSGIYRIIHRRNAQAFNRQVADAQGASRG
jgi:hypothetical protein